MITLLSTWTFGLALGLVALGVEPLLAGILVTTALASVSLVILGRSNVPLTGMTTLFDRAASGLGPAVAAVTGCDEATADEAGRMVFALACVAIACGVLYLFFRTNLGTAMRAGGDTRSMARALGRNTGALTIAGLAISNSFTAFAGGLIAQYQRFADVQMGIGMVVWGMASVFLGAALAGPARLGGALVATAAGSVAFRLIVATALRAGLHPDWLKAATAVVVLAALVGPRLMTRPRTAPAVR